MQRKRNKLWEHPMKENLSYEQAVENLGCYFTRPVWDGFHFIDGNRNHAILTKDKEIIVVTEEEVQSKDCNDWMLVSIKDEVVGLVQDHQYSIL